MRRTTEPRHYESCRHIWNMLLEKGHIRLDKYAGWYSVRDEAFFTETELVDGKAPTGAPVEWVEEPSYFFALSEWQQPLLDYYEAHPDFIAPAGRLNEIRSFVKGGLKDLSISRTTFDWGVPVPNDDDHVMYVWLDALTNYLRESSQGICVSSLHATHTASRKPSLKKRQWLAWSTKTTLLDMKMSGQESWIPSKTLCTECTLCPSP